MTTLLEISLVGSVRRNSKAGCVGVLMMSLVQNLRLASRSSNQSFTDAPGPLFIQSLVFIMGRKDQINSSFLQGHLLDSSLRPGLIKLRDLLRAIHNQCSASVWHQEIQVTSHGSPDTFTSLRS